MLQTLVAFAVLAALAVAQESCENTEWISKVEFEKQIAQVNGELSAWQNTTAIILTQLLGHPGNNEQCTCQESIEELRKQLQQSEAETTRNVTLSDRELLEGIQDQLEQLRNTITQNPVGSYDNPGTSCNQIAKLSPGSLPGYTWIQTSSGATNLVYCTPTTQCCGSSGGWMRVANLDMTDPHQTCPQGFKQFSSPKRACGRTLNRGGCNSVTFPVHGVSYRKVCGRIIGYHLGTPSGFYTPYYGGNSIDGPYLEGVSVTYGQSPRKHIWSFANALQEATGFDGNRHICPCTNPASTMQQYIPNFVGNDYFCDSGIPSGWSSGVFYSDDPLWDGQGCGLQSTCCTFNNPPFFCKELPHNTTNDIEVRICADENNINEDSPIELIELYIQ